MIQTLLSPFSWLNEFDLMFMCYAILRYRTKNPGWLLVFNDADYLDTLTVYRDRHKYPSFSASMAFATSNNALQSSMARWEFSTFAPNPYCSMAGGGITDTELSMEERSFITENHHMVKEYLGIHSL